MGGLQFPYQPGNVGYNKQGKSLRRDSVSENRKVRGIFSTFLKWFILTTFGIGRALKILARASAKIERKQANDC